MDSIKIYGRAYSLFTACLNTPSLHSLYYTPLRPLRCSNEHLKGNL